LPGKQEFNLNLKNIQSKINFYRQFYFESIWHRINLFSRKVELLNKAKKMV